MRELLARIVAAVEEAGAVIRGARPAAAVGAGTVTAADRLTDAFLRERLLALRSCAWLSEETPDSTARLTHNEVWIVDPLDGTREFVRGIPEYTVSVALVVERMPELAVVHNPVSGETYSAMRGAGAFCGAAPLHVREGIRLEASRAEVEQGEFEPFRAAWCIRPVGSIAGKLAHVAAGRAAVTLSRGPKHEWDVCAGVLLVREAGGRVSDLHGRPLLFNRPIPLIDGILAGAPRAYARAAGLAAPLGMVRRS